MGNSIIIPIDDDVDDSHVESLIESLIQEEDNLRIRPETIDFLRNAHLYLQCREQLDAKYLEVDEFQLISQLEDVDVKLEIIDEHQQMAISGGKPIKTLDELYEAAIITQPEYQDYVKELVNQVCEACGDSTETVDIEFASLKGKQRALEKASDDYSGRNLRPGISWLYDIVRGSIKFASAKQVLECLEIMQSDPSICIVNAKNRFKRPTLTGYRDLNLHFQLNTQEGFCHICEIQIHHAELTGLGIKLQSHKLYTYFRKYFAGATGKLKERLSDLRLVAGGQALDSQSLHDLLDGNEDEYRLHRIATLFREYLCEFEVAQRVYCHLLKVQLDHYGPEHITIASSYHRIARVLSEQGKLDQALKLYKLALRLYKKLHGMDHPTIAATYNDIGCVLWLQGELELAMKLYQEASERFKNMCGMEHPFVGITYSNMAGILLSQGENDEATKLYQQSLDMKQKTYGQEHVEVATAYNKVAQAWKDKGELDKAMALYEVSLDVYRKTLGERHADVAGTLFGMASVQKQKGNWDDAMKLYRQSLDIFQNTRGEQHPYVVVIYRNMADLMRLQDEVDSAKELDEKWMAIENKMKGKSEMESRAGETSDSIVVPEFIGR